MSFTSGSNGLSSGFKFDTIKFTWADDFALPDIRNHRSTSSLRTETIPEFIKRITVGRRTRKVSNPIYMEKIDFLFYLLNREIVIVYQFSH